MSTKQASELIFENVGKMVTFKKRQMIILKDCSFRADPGKLTVLIGPSGCGKTTVINLIAGYERPDLGEVRMDGRTITGPAWERLVVFQETALFPWLTCYDNVMFGPLARKVALPSSGRLSKCHIQDLRISQKSRRVVVPFAVERRCYAIGQIG